VLSERCETMSVAGNDQCGVYSKDFFVLQLILVV